MDKSQKVEFTPEGLKKAIDSLDFLPEDQREAKFKSVILFAMLT